MRFTLALPLLLAACSAFPTGDADELRLRTDEYVYFPGTPLTATLSNRLDEAIFISHCNFRPQLAVERRTVAGWVVAAQLNGPACLAIYPSGELRLDPGRSLSASLPIESEGEYRLVVHARLGWQDFGDLTMRSNSFRVRYPPD